MLRAGWLLGPGVCRVALVRRRMIPQTDAATFWPPTDAGYINGSLPVGWVWLTLSPAVAIPLPPRTPDRIQSPPSVRSGQDGR
jgi:hypothetical protein